MGVFLSVKKCLCSFVLFTSINGFGVTGGGVGRTLDFVVCEIFCPPKFCPKGLGLQTNVSIG